MYKKQVFGFSMLFFCTPFCAKGDLNIGEVAQNLLSGANILSVLLLAACFIAGITLLFSAFAQYKIHRFNPKLVPLINPCAYFLFALILLAVPFFDYIFGFEKTSSPYIAPKQKQGEISNTEKGKPIDIDEEFEDFDQE